MQHEHYEEAEQHYAPTFNAASFLLKRSASLDTGFNLNHQNLEEVYEYQVSGSKRSMLDIDSVKPASPRATIKKTASKRFSLKGTQSDESGNLSRSFLLHKPGFYVLKSNILTRATKPADGAEPDGVATSKRRHSRREKIKGKLLFKGTRKVKETSVSLRLKVRDIHDRQVFVLHSYDATPTMETYCRVVQTKQDGADEQCVILNDSSLGSYGSCCFFLDPKHVPCVVEVFLVANQLATVRTELYSSFADIDPRRPGVAEKKDTAERKKSFHDRSMSDAGKELLSEALSGEAPPQKTLSLSIKKTRSASERVSNMSRFSSWSHQADVGGAYFTGVDTGANTKDRRPTRGHSVFAQFTDYQDSVTTISSEEDDDDGDEPVMPVSDLDDSTLRTTFRGGLVSLNSESAHLKAVSTTEAAPKGLESEDTSTKATPGSKLDTKLLPLVTKGRWFYEYNGPNEPLGRAVLLRGVNLSGNVKLPYSPNSESRLRFDWGKLKNPAIAKELSFVGRPFPLEEANEHFSRLRRWGFNCLRFLVTWEAIEHAGPGEYDIEYLDYVELVVRIAGSFGFYVFIDPHQDVWSRMTGGSGAPAWTFEKAGLDLAKLESCEACFTHNNCPNPEKFQKMSWPQNYQRFACLHMFTLFWGGNDFAPTMCVDGGIPIQEYLQRHFIDSMMQIVARVKNMPHVLGFDSFNEPSPGFIGNRLDEFLDPVIPPGPVFRPFDSMITASGFQRTVNKANGIGLMTGKYLANPNQHKAWLPGVKDVWREQGVWDVEHGVTDGGRKFVRPRLLRPDYFCKFPRSGGRECQFFRDYLRPFMVLYISKIRSLMPGAILFAEGDGFGEKEFCWDHRDPKGVVNTSHWYDGYTLFTANFNPRFSVDVKTKLPVFGQSRIYSMHYRDLSEIISLPAAIDGKPVEMPTLIGEFGIPYNMNNKAAYKNGDFKMQEKALSMYYDVFDALQLHSTQWNYCADNSNKWGDNWNLEDLSLFSRDQQTVDFQININSGGRAIKGFSRPFAPFVCGVPRVTVFSSRTGNFEHTYEPNSRNFEFGVLQYATEIFVPDIHYLSKGGRSYVKFDIVVEGGRFQKRQLPGRHVIYVWADKSTMNTRKVVSVRILGATSM
uniref:Uncharacterized protein n=1 Tax=Mucochytrium quahogii TaxID=96639 RepID=A0A7S2WQ34_9STRA|mmetsp:Transcript_24227/g.39283  ORF Transcript_24227/g.39283 Transcript_24227/m.39283 type:complete len:1117 (-) Transcript_24227:2553-5903(-)